MLRHPILLTLGLLWIFLLGWTAAPRAREPSLNPPEIIGASVRKLVKMQSASGEWPYSGSFGLRVGCTAVVAQTLLLAAPDDKDAQAAVQRGLAYVLTQLHHHRSDSLDCRIWGHGFALEFLCHVRAHKIADKKYGKQVEMWIPRMVEALIQEEIPGGGWNYESLDRSASHVTAPVAQSLLLARSQDEKVPDAIFNRARQALEAARTKDGAFAYEGAATNRNMPGRLSLPGSVSRAVACEATLAMLGGSSVPAVKFALDNFYKYWHELEKRRQKSGKHEGTYGIAPYYFYYGHRYAAQTIQMLPEKDRALQWKRLWRLLLQSRNNDGAWNDCEAPDGSAYGTAVALIILLGDKTPLPPKLAHSVK